MRRFIARVLAALLLSSVAERVLAQASGHRVAGIVRDSVGGAVTSAAVTVTDAGGIRYMQQSDSAGRFDFMRVPRGRASLTVRRMGFHPFRK